MLDPQLKEKLAQGYAKLGDITYDIALNLRKGKDYTHRQTELWNQGIIMRLYLRKLFHHVAFTEEDIPVLYGEVTEEDINLWLDVIVKTGTLDRYPIVPSLLPNIKPHIVNKGTKGDQGDAGLPGSNANIIVEPDDGETAIAVEEVVISGVKHYKLSFNPYTSPELTIAIQGTKVFEVGTVHDFNINVSTLKGKDTVTAVTVIDPASLDAVLQPLLNFVAINGVSQPVVTVLPVTDVAITTLYQIRMTDGTNQDDSIDTALFVYPFLSGNNDSDTFDRYTLSKTIAAKGNLSFTLNGTDDYFFICYPVEYGNLSQIKDQNGFDVSADWEVATEDVTSNSLVTDWTKSYKVYKTINKTTINNKPFSIVFP